MALGVTPGYHMMICSQDFRVHRHVMNRRLVRNARKSSDPVLWNLSCSYATTLVGEAIHLIAAPNAPLAIALAVKWGYMGSCDNMRAREGFVRS